MNVQSFSTFGSKHNTVSITCLNSFCFFSDVIETLIESHVDGYNVNPLMTDKEEVDPQMKGKEVYSNSITVDSSRTDAIESSNFLTVEDRKIGLGSSPLLKSFKG